MPAGWVVSLLVSIPWRWLPSFEIAPALPVPAEAPAPAPTARLPDEIVLRVLDTGRAAFTGCWRRAHAADPLLETTKVTIRVELDDTGRVRAITHDAPSAKLGGCLALVARSLRFPATRPAVAEFPLIFDAPGG